MYNEIIPLLTPSNPKINLRWDKMLNDMQTRIDITKNRFLLSDINLCPSIYLLKALISSVDIDQLLELSDDAERYSRYIIFAIDKIKPFFDISQTKREVKNVFVDSKKTVEILLNVQYAKPLIDLPLDEGWEKWKDTKPVEILFYKSLEYPTLLQYQLKFKTDPEYAVIAINFPVLILKFVHYLKEFYPKKKDREYFEHMNEFLKEGVFVKFYENNITIWATNVLLNNLYEKEEMPRSSMSVSSTVDAIRLLKKSIVKVKTNKITIRDFCNTTYLNGNSIVSLMNYYNDKLSIPDIRQFAYLKLIRNLPAILIITGLCEISENPASAKIKTKFRKALRLLENNKTINMIPNDDLFESVQEDLDFIAKVIDFE